MAYATNEGLKLSSIIRNRMDEYFREYTPPNSDVYNVFSASKEPDVIPRTKGILGHFSVAYGIQEYFTNYCNINLTANRYAQATEIALANVNGSTVGLIGSLNLDYFPLFMMPMTLRTDNNYIQDKKEALKKLMKSILTWVSLPFLKAKTHYVDDKFYFDSDLNIGFGIAFDEIDGIVDEVFNEMESLKSSNQLNFKTSWDTVATGLVKLFNFNEIFSSEVDAGIGAIYEPVLMSLPAPLLPPYVGITEGTVIFGSDFYVNISLKILDGTLGIPDIKVPYASKVQPSFSTITFTDKTTNETKEYIPNIRIDRIEGTVDNVLDEIEIKTKEAINRECDFVYKKLLSESSISTSAFIVPKIIDIMKTLQPIANQTYDYLNSNIGESLEKTAKLMTRVQRVLTWILSYNIPPGIGIFVPPATVAFGYSIYLEDVLQTFIDEIDNVNNAIDCISDSVGKAINNFTKLGTKTIIEVSEDQFVNQSVQEKYFPDDDEVFSFDNINDTYKSIAAYIVVGNAAKVLVEAKKLTNSTVTKGTAQLLLTSVKSANQAAANNQATVASFNASKALYQTLKTTTPLPQSPVNTTDVDYLIQKVITEAVGVAFNISVLTKKTTIIEEVNTIDQEEVWTKLQNGQDVYEV